MSRAARILNWNGTDVPSELQGLPAGRYVVEPLEEAGPELTPEQDTGLEVALASYRAGKGLDARRAREVIAASLAR